MGMTLSGQHAIIREKKIFLDSILFLPFIIDLSILASKYMLARWNTMFQGSFHSQDVAATLLYV